MINTGILARINRFTEGTKAPAMKRSQHYSACPSVPGALQKLDLPTIIFFRPRVPPGSGEWRSPDPGNPQRLCKHPRGRVFQKSWFPSFGMITRLISSRLAGGRGLRVPGALGGRRNGCRLLKAMSKPCLEVDVQDLCRKCSYVLQNSAGLSIVG